MAVALLGAALPVWSALHELSRERYFTIDEYQFAHATWLVSEGRRPYVDFYEHHFPASYVMHAPLVADEAPFVTRMLRLRRAIFVEMALLACAMAVGTGLALRSAPAGLLAGVVPFAFGFSALSAIDYRADNVAGFAWIGCLLALEANRERARRDLAVLAGALLALALLATQKLALLAGPPLALLLGLDAWGRRRRRAPFVARPLAFVGTAGLLVSLALAVAGALGLWGPGFEATVLHAFAHEELYPDVDVRKYLDPFLAETAPGTALLAGFAVVGLVSPGSRIWAAPFAMALASGLLLKGAYPYNFVTLCLIGGLLAVRGFAACVERVARIGPRAAVAAPLLYLLPLALLPAQIGFTQGRTSNAHQRHVLEKIERFTTPSDVVIDNAGGALFRRHASRTYYHGPAHRALLADHFEGPYLDDLRESRAPFWIRDLRSKRLPKPVRDYLRGHYVRADGWLYALGFAIPPTWKGPLERDVDVVRAGRWFAYPAPRGRVAPHAGPVGVSIDGRPVGPGGIELAEGVHRLRVARGAPPHVVTPLPREVFLDRVAEVRPYSPLFEYHRRPRPDLPEPTILTW